MTSVFTIVPANSHIYDYACDIKNKLQKYCTSVDIDMSYGLNIPVRIQKHISNGKDVILLDDACKFRSMVKVRFQGKQKQVTFSLNDFIDLVESFNDLDDKDEINKQADVEMGKSEESISSDAPESSDNNDGFDCIIM